MANNKPITAEEYLQSLGINLKQTALLTVIDGYMRTPDLCVIMENYASEKIRQQEDKKPK